VPLNEDEIYELQEKLLLLYKFICQNRLFKEFYCLEIELKPEYKNDKGGLICKLINMNEAEELLKNCIIELEEMKVEKGKLGHQINSYYEFQEILDSQDWILLYKLYGMKNLDDIWNLDLELLLKIF